jgi:hypothetical protein
VADAVGIAPEGRAALLEELRELWAARLVSIGPLRPGA